MIDRIKFWLADKPFIYTSTGFGLAVESYNPLSDIVRVRTSQFGTVTSIQNIKRTEYSARAALTTPEKDAPK